MKSKVLKERKCKECKQLFMQERPLQYLCGFRCAGKIVKRKFEQIQNKEHKELKIVVYEKENKKYLQNEINKLSRMIDAKFGFVTCIDCNKLFGKQIDAAHFHSTGSNSSLRYHLDNLHSAKSDCNQYSNQHISGYKIGLMERYGKKYAKYVIEELPLKYPIIKLSSKEIHEKLAVVRKLIRGFDTFIFDDALDARKKLNKIIGIYK